MFVAVNASPDLSRRQGGHGLQSALELEQVVETVVVHLLVARDRHGLRQTVLGLCNNKYQYDQSPSQCKVQL